MGAWGYGNFDDGLSLDYVGNLCAGLESEIDGFHFKSGLGVDEFLNDVMPRIAVLTVLVEHCLRTAPPKPTVLEWKKRFLKIYEQQIDELGPDPDFKEKRLATIIATFDKLLEFAGT